MAHNRSSMTTYPVPRKTARTMRITTNEGSVVWVSQGESQGVRGLHRMWEEVEGAQQDCVGGLRGFISAE